MNRNSLQRYSSKFLTHFVGQSLAGDNKKQYQEKQYELLTSILKSGWLKSKWVIDNNISVTSLPVSVGGYPKDISNSVDLNSIFMSEVICFADIPFPDLEIHVRKYSEFGIAFTKQFLLQKGATPVFYVCSNASDSSPRNQNLGEAFRNSIKAIIEYRDYYLENRAEKDQFLSKPASDESQVQSFLLTHILPMIKFWKYSENDNDYENYYLEREWRIRVALDFTLADVNRVIVPKLFAERFRKDLPEYSGEILFSPIDL